MVTQKGREKHIAASVQCYRSQTFKDKELVVIHDGDAVFHQTLEQICGNYKQEAIRIFQTEPGKSFGQLRNMTIELATYSIVCQWDDDDLYHPNRLQTQFEHLEAEEADCCFMTDQLHLFADSKFIFWDDWRHETPPGDLIQGTLMGKKQLLSDYPNVARGEDTKLVHDLVRNDRKIARLSDQAWLYVYVYHGKNASEESHHKVISRQKRLKYKELKDRIPILEKKLASYSYQIGTVYFPHEKGNFEVLTHQSKFSENTDLDVINKKEAITARESNFDPHSIAKTHFEKIWKLSGATSYSEIPKDPSYSRYRCKLHDFMSDRVYVSRAVNADRSMFLRSFDKDAYAISFYDLAVISDLCEEMLRERMKNQRGRRRQIPHLIVEKCTCCGVSVIKDGCKELLALVKQSVNPEIIVTEVAGSNWNDAKYDMRLACQCRSNQNRSNNNCNNTQ